MVKALNFVTMVFVAALNGCSGGSSPPESSTSVVSKISGVVSAGPVNAATVTAFALNSDGAQGITLGTAITDTNGEFQMTIAPHDGPVAIVAAGGSYLEEGSGSSINLASAQIRTLLPSIGNGLRIGITPVTEIAAQSALNQIFVNPLVRPSSIINNSNAVVASAMGLSDITLSPADPAQPASSARSIEAAKYALVLSALSELAVTATTVAGSEVNSLDLMQALATSFTYNGAFSNTIGATAIPVPNANGSSVDLNSVLTAGGATTFSSAMLHSLQAYLTSSQAIQNGFNSTTFAPGPAFVDAPAAPVGAPSLTLPTQSGSLPTFRPIDSGPPSVALPVPTSPWIQMLTEGGEYISNAVAVDTNGNGYVAGIILGNVPFKFGEGVVANGTSAGCNGVLVKYNSSGTTQWAKTLLSNETCTAFSSVAIDKMGNLYVVGYVNGDFHGTFINGIPVPGDSINAVLAKYSSAGIELWRKTVTSSVGLSEFAKVTIDSSGDILVAGSVSGNSTFNFGNGQSAIGTSQNSDAILVKYDSSGAAQWVRLSSMPSSGFSLFKSVTADATGNIYLSGYAGGAGSFDFGNTISVNGTSDVHFGIVVKFNSSGVAQWATSSSPGVHYNSLKVSVSGNIYVAANGAGSLNFGNGVTATGAAQNGNAVLIKYDPSGAAQWAAIESSAFGANLFRDLALDSSENIYLVGGVGRGPYNFGNGITGFGDSMDNGGPPSNGLLIRYNSSGVPQSAIAIGSNDSNQKSSLGSICVDSDGNVYATGLVELGEFGIGNHLSVTSNFVSGAVIVKFGPNPFN